MIKILKEIEPANSRDRNIWRNPITNVLLIALGIALFLFSIDLMGTALNELGAEAARSILLATQNPFIGLFIGLLITAIIQSSSTSTAMIVAVVASGSLSFYNAVPLIMGANIGTTLTSTIVSLGYITHKKEFRKAISAGTIHDFYNIFIVTILFPLEYYYGFVSNLTIYIKDLIIPENPDSFYNGQTLHSVWNPLNKYLMSIFPNDIIVLFIAFALLFISIKILSQSIYRNFIGSLKDVFKKYIFKNTYKSFALGIVLTAGVQSSSITTSLIVPLVATGKVSLRKIFPFIIGANLGTTITALLASLFRSEAAISIALTHLLFNLIGVLIFLPIASVRKFPVLIASRFGRITMHYRIIGFVYIILIFFMIPFGLIYFNREEDVNKANKQDRELLHITDRPKND